MKRSLSRNGLPASTLAALFVTAVPISAQVPQQFKADMEMSGGSLDEPVSGTMYRGDSRVRMELTYDNETFIILDDPAQDVQYMLMPDDEMYMELSAGMAPVSTPSMMAMDPDDPCASGDVTNCVSLGEEDIDGYPTTVWQYDQDGETWTAWIAASIGFPLRVVSSDGTTTEYQNVEMGTQTPSLFEIPENYEPMAGLGGFGGFGPGGASPTGGIDLSAFGVDVSNLDPATLAAIAAAAGGPAGPVESSAWEEGEGWIVTLTIRASGEGTSGTSGTEPGTIRSDKHDTYSIESHASVPLNYGAPGTGAMGPRWQLIPGLGSERANALPITFSATSAFRSDYVGYLPECGSEPSATQATTTTGSTGTGGNVPAIGFIQISPDLQSYDLTIGVGSTATETTTTVSNYAACQGEPASSDTSTSTLERMYEANIELAGLPLPGSPATITGTRTLPLPFSIGGFSGDLDATVEWTLTPIGG